MIDFICLFKDCPILTSPTNGILSTTEVAEGTIVDITCDSAHTLEGANQISCLPGGSWNDALPECTEGKIILSYYLFLVS